MRSSHLILVLVCCTILCRQATCLSFKFSPPNFPYATAPYNFEAAGGKNKDSTQVKLLAVKRGRGALPPNKPSAAGGAGGAADDEDRPRCTLELQVVQRVNGVCVDSGRTNACNAGTYLLPFHPDCIPLNIVRSRSRGRM